MNIRIKPLAALLTLAFAPPSFASDTLVPLDSVVVTATRQALRINEAIADITVLDKQDIQQASPASTLGEFLARSSGIEFGRSGGPGAEESIYIRGTNSGHALILIDGVRVNSATYGGTALQMIPLAQIERVEILRGPASALYGSDAIGGVIQIFTKPSGDGPRFTAQAGIGSGSLYETSVSHANQLGDFSYSVKAGSSGTQGINAIKSQNYPGYNQDHDGFYNNNVNISAAYRVTSAFDFGGGYFESRSSAKYDAYKLDPMWNPVEANRNYRMDHLVTGSYAYANLNPVAVWKSTFRIDQGVDRTESPESMIGDPISIFKTTQNQYTWQNDLKLPLGIMLFGLERLEQEVDSSKNYSAKSRSINAALAGWNATIDRHSVQLNLRVDDNSQFGSHETWLAGYGYKISSAWQIAGSLGTAFKAPTMNDLYFPTTPGVGGGNANLKPEESRNSEISLRYRQGPQFARLTYFRNTIDNLIEWTTDPITYYSTPANVGKARIQGLEFSAGTSIGQWLLSTNITLQDPKDLDTGEQLRRRAKSFGSLMATYISGPFKGGIEWKVVGHRYDDPDWQTRLNQVRMGGYSLTNLFAEYSLGKDWKVFTRIDNLFDKEYDVARSASMIYGTPGLSAFAGLRYSFQ